MGISPLLGWFLSLWTERFSKAMMSGTSKQVVSSSILGQESVSETKSEKESKKDWTNVESNSVRFKLFVSQSIFFETGGDKSGGYTNDPDDRGGETKWGISKRAHPHLNIKSLTYNNAVEIYRDQYWNRHYDYIRSNALGFKLFDMGILNGRGRAVKILQKAVKASGYLVRVDSNFGPISLAAVNNINPEVLYENYIKRFETRFRKLVIRIQNNKKYLRGWLNRLHWKWAT